MALCKINNFCITAMNTFLQINTFFKIKNNCYTQHSVLMKHFLWPLSHQNIWKWIHWYEYFRLDKFTNNIPVTPSCEGEEEYPNISTYSEWETIGGTIPTSRRRMRMRSSVLRLTQKKWVHCFPYLKLIQPSNTEQSSTKLL